MHKIEIPHYVIDRVKARRGRLHAFDTLTPRATALLVIDLQNAFMLPGMQAEIPFAREIVPNVNAIARALRDRGGTVVWIKMTHAGARWNVYLDHLCDPRFRDTEVAQLNPGHRGHELYDGLDVQAQDAVIEKTRFSAFIQGSSDLDALLRKAGIDTVIVTGTVTNTCCESTARDAMMLDYKTIFVSDANACRTDEEHNTTLANILRIFGDVQSTHEVVAALSPREELHARQR